MMARETISPLTIGLLLFFYVMSSALASEARTSISKGCRIRTEGLLAPSVPDIVPNPKLHRGMTLKESYLESLKRPEVMEQLDLEPGDGFVVFCTCRTRSSNPTHLIAAVEYRGSGNDYVLHRTVVRQALTFDLKNRIDVIIATVSAGEFDHAGSNSQYPPTRFPKQELPSNGQTLGTGALYSNRRDTTQAASSIRSFVGWSISGRESTRNERSTFFWNDECR